ncbi:MAG: hypothetical protein DME34_11050 [Verrucomicrobia bacterium]|nr:MAG: hypothetical protein DME34_11050 [Verrucomicrobiota bacterium]
MKLFSALLLVCASIALIVSGVPPNINVTKTHGNEAETAVAASHTNPLLITTVSNLDSGAGTSHSWSTDGGRTWNHNVIADGDALGFSCCDGQLAADDFGNIFFTYLSSDIAVKVALSTDGGATFQPVQFLTTLPFGLPVGPWRSLARIGQAVSGDQPSIAAGAGSVWISWTSFDGTIKASGAAVTGLGQVGTFSPAQGVPGSNRFGDYGDTAIGPNYGALDPDGLGPQGFGAGQLIVTSNVGGFDYIPAQSGRSIDIEAGLAWDRTGGPHNRRLYFIYTSEEPQESNDTDIQFRYSDDNGATWSNSVRVNDDVGTTSQFNPRISLDSTTGNIAIAWYDCRNDRGDHGFGDTNGRPNDDTMVYTTVSKDGGATFSRNRRLSAAASDDNDAGSGVDYGDYSGFAFYNGRLYFSAADNSNSTGDNPDGTLHEYDLYVAPTGAR